MTDIGKLDQLITFEAEQRDDDGYGGGGEPDWSQHAQAWARVRPVRGREGEREGAVRGATIYLIEVWQDGLETVTDAMRINWDDVLLNIREIRRPPVRTQMMTIVAEAGVTL